MADLTNLLATINTGEVPIYAERGDGMRQKLMDAPDLATAKKMMEHLAKKWTSEGLRGDLAPPRTTEMPDKLTVLCMLKGELVTTLYADPLPDRSNHDADVRVDRKHFKRKPIP